MNKVLIELFVPAIGDHFDIFAPLDVEVSKLNKIIAHGVEEITDGRYTASENEQLCLKEPYGLLSPSLSLRDYGATDGMQLYLI